jgi:hypothetical protein
MSSCSSDVKLSPHFHRPHRQKQAQKRIESGEAKLDWPRLNPRCRRSSCRECGAAWAQKHDCVNGIDSKRTFVERKIDEAVKRTVRLFSPQMTLADVDISTVPLMQDILRQGRRLQHDDLHMRLQDVQRLPCPPPWRLRRPFLQALPRDPWDAVQSMQEVRSIQGRGLRRDRQERKGCARGGVGETLGW